MGHEGQLHTSPSALNGTKSSGNSRSYTNSVLGKRPRSLSKKKDTQPAETIFWAKVSGTEASSAASLIAVSRIPKPTLSPPLTMLSHLLGQVCFVGDLCCSQMHSPFWGWRIYPLISTPKFLIPNKQVADLSILNSDTLLRFITS